MVLASLAFTAIATPQLPDPGKAPMTRPQQMQMGFQAASQVYQQMPVLPDTSPETQYIRKLGKRLVATIPAQNSWPFEFHTVPQKEINAFALPGGPMFVNVGTITAASNEAELAAVMGHEMSHVYMQHSAKQQGKAQTTETIAGIAGAILGETEHGVIGSMAQEGLKFGAQGLMLKYSRTDEAQADHVGAIILYKAGYNPQAMADFFKKLAAEGSAGPQFLSDHPNPGNREEAIQKEIASWPPQKYNTGDGSFAATRQHAAGLKVYTAQEIAQGAKNGQWAKLNKQNGGAFEPYKKLLHGDAYTTYIDTALGTVVMEFSDEQATRGFGGNVTAPAPIRNDLPEGLPRARMVVTCTLDASGNVRNLKVLEPASAAMTAKVVAALRSWKFQPAMKNNQPVEVTAILGFGIDTNDRF